MNIYEESANNAEALLEQLMSKKGFLASKTTIDNYDRVFARDAIIIGLATLTTNNKKLQQTFKRSLDTLKKHQETNGIIASNVSKNKVSFGQTTGRVDATLWYIIGVCKYYAHTKNKTFLKAHKQHITKALEAASCWEFNTKDFIYTPRSGDWADEYIQEGYVLYDQLLYYKALKNYYLITRKKSIKEKAERLKKRIHIHFYPEKKQQNHALIYHEILFKHLLKKKKNYFLQSFSPGQVQDRFDCFAHALLLEEEIATKEQEKQIIKHIKKLVKQHTLIPAFHPIITKQDNDWQMLKNNYSFRFKNKEGAFHNGGLWLFVNALLARALYLRGHIKLSEELYYNTIQETKKHNWSFHEFTNSITKKPGGVQQLGMSAAAILQAHNSIYKK